MFASESSPTKGSRIALRLAMLIAMAALAGCATRQSLDLPELGEWEQRRYLLSQVDEWEFNGRIGVVAGEDGFNGSLRWSQDGDDFQATVSGPLGIGTVRLEGDDRRVQLTDNDGNVTVLEDAETDLYVRYGWTIPVRSPALLGARNTRSGDASGYRFCGRRPAHLAQAGRLDRADLAIRRWRRTTDAHPPERGERLDEGQGGNPSLVIF